MWLVLASGSLETWQHTELKHLLSFILSSHTGSAICIVERCIFDLIRHHVVDPMHALFGIAMQDNYFGSS